MLPLSETERASAGLLGKSGGRPPPATESNAPTTASSQQLRAFLGLAYLAICLAYQAASTTATPNRFTPKNVRLPAQTVHRTRALLPTALVSADTKTTGQRGTLVRRVDLSPARSRTHVNKRRQHEHAKSTWAPPPPLLPACPQSNTTRRRWCSTTGGASGERSHLLPSCSSNGGPQ